MKNFKATFNFAVATLMATAALLALIFLIGCFVEALTETFPFEILVAIIAIFGFYAAFKISETFNNLVLDCIVFYLGIVVNMKNIITKIIVGSICPLAIIISFVYVVDKMVTSEYLIAYSVVFIGIVLVTFEVIRETYCYIVKD